MDLRSYLKSKPILALAPMDGITDEPFRLVQCHIAKPDLMFTEFVSAEGISRGGLKLFDHLLFREIERPIIGQLFGKNPDDFYRAAIILCHLGFDGIDINMGCPAKTVTQHGSGAALIEKPMLAGQIIKSVKQAIADFTSGKASLTDLNLKKKELEIINRNLNYSNYQDRNKLIQPPTISVKTRLGTNNPAIETWIPFLLEQGIDLLSLHGRTLKQGYSGEADWDLIGKTAQMCRKTGTIFFGNGDVDSTSKALEYINKYQLNGVLIGRHAMGNPWVFSPNNTPSLTQKFETMLYHAEISRELFPNRPIDPLRKHFLLYTSGHPHAKSLRADLVRINSINDLQGLEEKFLS